MIKALGRKIKDRQKTKLTENFIKVIQSFITTALAIDFFLFTDRQKSASCHITSSAEVIMRGIYAPYSVAAAQFNV